MPVAREMTEADIEQVAILEKACFAMPWSRQSLVSEVTVNPDAHYWVLEEEGEIVAYGGFWKIFDEGHITNMAVVPNMRGQGYGKRMLLTLMRAALLLGATKMTLEVRVSNARAISLYEKMGFTICGRRKGYYSNNGEDAWVMWNETIDKTISIL